MKEAGKELVMHTRISINKDFKVIIVAVCLLAIGASGTLGAPYKGELFEFKQPDGATVQVRVWGDEFYQRVESLDGYTLIRNKGMRICYAKLSANAADFEATDVVYDGGRVDMDRSGKKALLDAVGVRKGLRLSAAGRRAKVRAGRKRLSLEPTDQSEPGAAASAAVGAPLLGAVTGLTICVDFIDESGYFTTAQVDDYLNLPGYGTYGSVRDYFYDVSAGNLTYTNIVTGYYTALHEKSYYDDPSRSCGYVGQEIVGEALDWLEDQGFDFTQITCDGDNRMLAINVYYAGSANAGWSNGLWPHMWVYTGFTSSSEVESYTYQITSMDSSLVLRTFCHENGHMICDWPDLYDYGYESRGVGNYCLMGYGGSDSNPVPPNAYFRHLKGWDTVTDITNAAPGSSHFHQANSNTCFQYRNESYANESFYIESRLKNGRNSSLPDEGLVIWHVDSAGSNDNEQMTPSLHYEVSLEQADGAFDLENNRDYGDSYDLFHAGYNDSFTDSTMPDAKWWDGSDSGLEVVNIGLPGATMDFWVNTQQFPPTAYDDSYAAVSGQTLTVNAPGVLANDDDPDGDPLTAVLQTTTTNGTLNLNSDGSFVYTPDTEFTGTDSFTYVANDTIYDSAAATVTIDVGVILVNQHYAQSESTASGAVTGGTLGSTYAIDGDSEVVTETISGRNPRVQKSELEHVWVFDVTAGDTTALKIVVEGQIEPGSLDEFELAYSTDGSSYTTITVTSGGALSGSDYTLPGGIGGTVYIRVQDTDRSKAERSLDSIAVDYLCIETQATGLPDEEPPTPDPMAWGVAPHATGSTSISMTATTAADAGGVEYYFMCTAGGGNDSGWQSGTTYEDTGLTPEQTYTYTVTARDKSPNLNETAPSDPASATTLAAGSGAYIDGIVMASIKAGRNYKGQAVVSVLDGPGGAPVGSRTVTGNWYFPDEYTLVESGVTALTDASGTTVFTSAPRKVSTTSTFTFVVVSVDGYDSVAGNVSGSVDVP